ncbi:MAG: hypothetical protein K0S01_1430 [Herbinix sp.]|jgi:hypothetical protein|nr:hypothetical protein [Herbinix sp.]
MNIKPSNRVTKKWLSDQIDQRAILLQWEIILNLTKK